MHIEVVELEWVGIRKLEWFRKREKERKKREKKKIDNEKRRGKREKERYLDI
jgi:hypothetical protein